MRISNCIICILILSLTIVSCCNDDDSIMEPVDPGTEFCLVKVGNEFVELSLDKKPQYLNGGEIGLLECLYSKTRYTAMAKENRTEGIVELRYIINEEGEVTEVMIHKDLEHGLGEEAKRAFEQCVLGKSFSPAEIDSKKQTIKKQQNVKFKLE